MTFSLNRLDPNVDPRYYYQMLSQEDKTVHSASNISDTVLVTAIINDLKQWQHLDGVVTRSIIPANEASWLITASVRRSVFESVSQQPFVKNIEISQEVGAVDH